jgi:hypothetical protein
MTDIVLTSESRQKQAQALFDERRWSALWQFKKECKKSWESLGFSQRNIERIHLNKPDWI